MEACWLLAVGKLISMRSVRTVMMINLIMMLESTIFHIVATIHSDTQF